MLDMMLVILQAVVIAVVPIVAVFSTNWLKAKTVQAQETTKSIAVSRYLEEISDAIVNSIRYTAQNYVDDIKGTEAWDSDAQATAARRALNTAKDLLSNDALKYIQEIRGDVNTYLLTLIDAEIRARKEEPNDRV